MSRQVNVTGLTAAQHSRFREVCKELGGEAKAARAVFVRGLGGVAAKKAPAPPPAPAPKKKAKKRKAPPALEAPPTVLLDGDA